jgi:hypothetical protein
LVNGLNRIANTKPIMIMYDDRLGLRLKSFICKMKAGIKTRLQMKASFDKNKSQRMDDFRVK